VAKAETGQDGLDLFKQHPADLVITDVVLPDKDGIHVILDLQKTDPCVKIIAMSGGGKGASGEEYLSDIQLLCNIEHTLAKPFARDKLFSMIREMLG
jgi:YesN/AraC family two-component response regulator